MDKQTYVFEKMYRQTDGQMRNKGTDEKMDRRINRPM